MAPSHRVIRLVVALIFGIAVAYGSYQWISDADRAVRRAQEESVVVASRDILRRYVKDENLQISDAVDRVRVAGKVYLYPTDDGWELSGHYRRENEKKWHAYLMSLDINVALVSLSVQDADAELIKLALSDPKFDASE